MNKKKKGILKQEPGVPEYQIELEMQNEELRRAQVELDLSRARYFDLYNNAPVCYVTVSEAGLILQANLTAATLLGVTQADLVRQPLPRFIQTEDADSYHLLCKKLLATRETQECELRLVKSGGAVLWAHLTATVASDEEAPVIRIVLSDVSGQKKAEEALHEREELYRSIAQTAEEGIWKINAASLTDYVNPKMAQMMGYKPEEMLGRPIDDFLDDEGRAMLANLIERRKNGITEQFEFKYIRKDGSELWAFMSTNPITNAQGVYVGAVALLTDISARREAEAALESKKTLLRTVLDLLPISIYVKDTEGRFVVANKGVAQALGAASWEQMIGKTDADYFPPAIAAAFRQDEVRVLAGEPVFNLEEPSVAPDGTARTELTTKVPQRNKEGEIIGLVGVSRDITSHKKADEALRASEALLRSINDHTEDGIFVKDLESRTIYQNPAAGRMNGLTEAQVLGRTDAEFLEDALQVAEFLAADRRVMESGLPETVEESFTSLTGSKYVLLTTKVARFDTEGKVIGLVGVSRDITERKRAEEALKASAEFRDSLICSMQDGFSVLDANGVQLEVNPALCLMTGFSKEELVGKAPPFPYWPPEEYENIDAAFQKTLSGNLGDFELIFLRKSGERFPVIVSPSVIKNLDGETINYLATVKDITDRKLAEAKYLRELKFNETLVDHTAVIIVLLDRQGRMEHVNQATVDILGYSRRELLGRTPWGVGMMGPEEKLRALERLKVLLKAGGSNPPRESILKAKDGTPHVFALSSVSTSALDGTVDRIIVTGADLTERNRLQREVLKISEQEQARIGHNLHDGVGQTMTGVATLMEALESDLEGEQRTDAARIRQLVQDAIQEVRRMSHSMSPAAVKNRGLDGVLQLLADTIRINHRTACTCKIDPGIRIGDAEKETHIYRIAQEAANNAIRHGKPTKITISLRHLGETGCVLKIEDNGSGIKKTKAKASDGIGLQVMDYRANLIGGTLKITSKPRRGVTVTCRFPCAPSKA